MRSLQRMIFAGCRELGLDEDARHDLQLAATGKASLSEMSEAELKLVVDRLKQSGFKPDFKGGKRQAAAPRGDLRFIHVLWRLLGDANALRDPSRAGLNAFIRTSFGKNWGTVPADVDMLRDAAKIDQVVQALKAWTAREGIVLKTGRQR